MKNCLDCINYAPEGCRTMTAKPKDRFCFMTREQAIKAEKDIMRYANDQENMHAANRYEAVKLCQRNIERLEGK